MLLKVQLEQINQELLVDFHTNDKAFCANFGDIQIVTDQPDIYEGLYEVTPKIDAQTIPTAKKFMTDDMTVKAIPYYNVSNIAGGNTIFIGNEV